MIVGRQRHDVGKSDALGPGQNGCQDQCSKHGDLNGDGDEQSAAAPAAVADELGGIALDEAGVQGMDAGFLAVMFGWLVFGF